MAHTKDIDPIKLLQRTPLIGPVTAKALVALGITTDKQLAEADPKQLCDQISHLQRKPVTQVIKYNIAYAIEELRAYKKERGYYPTELFEQVNREDR